jgi:hypothetical protein
VLKVRYSWLFSAVLPVFFTALPAQADVGSGRSLRPLVPVQQAGTGGIDLESRQVTGTMITGESIFFDPGLRWLGAGINCGLGEAARFRGEVFNLTTSDIRKTTEDSNGLYEGESGSAEYGEMGVRAELEFRLWAGNTWQAGLLGRVSSLTQRLPGGKSGMVAFEPGVIFGYQFGEGRSVQAWGLLGPFGNGMRDTYTGQFVFGSAYESAGKQLFAGGNEGFSVGVEGQAVDGSIWQAGLGGVLWIQPAGGRGMKYFLRAGLRHVLGSAQVLQPRGGAGVGWQTEDGFGLQIDYSVIPMGDLGNYNYLGVSVRLANEGNQAMGENPAEAAAPMPESVPAPELEGGQEVIYFRPTKGQKAVVRVRLSWISTLSADLLDRSGVKLRTLEEGRGNVQGWQEIEWDGTLAPGVLAPFGIPYLIRAYHENETQDFTVVPLQE